MGDEQQVEAFEKLMSANLGRVLDMLRFAEAKNAALLTFASAWILSLLALHSKDAQTASHPSLIWDIGLFAAAASISMLSFIPRITLRPFYTEIARSKGLLFFGDIAKLDIDDFREQFRDRYWLGSSAADNYFDDICIQIAINSKIARRKFIMFNVGAYVALLAIAATAISMVRC